MRFLTGIRGRGSAESGTSLTRLDSIVSRGKGDVAGQEHPEVVRAPQVKQRFWNPSELGENKP